MNVSFDDGVGCSLASQRFCDELGCIELDSIPDRQPQCGWRLEGASPLIERLWRCALFDVESNWLEREEGGFYAAGGRGKGWNGMIFTRDLAYAGILGINRVYPGQMRECLRTTRKVRLDLGLRVDREQRVEGLPFEVEDISEEAFKAKYGTNPYVRRTDDVLWLWWADDLISRHFDSTEEWQWIYETGARCFRELYDPFHDPKDGLYWGQSSFVDVGDNGYPESFGRGFNSIGNSLFIKATSTNCLYYKGMQVMAQAARRCGHPVEAGEWRTRAAGLRGAIRSQMLQPDGAVTYFLHRDGHPEPRAHALATAFAVLLNVIDGETAVRACRHFPVAWWGVPLFHPFYPNGECYHNNSSWPFASAFFLRAREKALGEDESMREIALIIRSCRGDTFHELIGAFEKLPRGKPAQMWTAGPFIGRCLDLFEVSLNPI